jgi:hypothetical protein
VSAYLKECGVCGAVQIPGHGGHMSGCSANGTAQNAIVRELAEMAGPIVIYYVDGRTACAMPGCHGHDVSRPEPWWSDPANHAPSCLWRRAKGLYPS